MNEKKILKIETEIAELSKELDSIHPKARRNGCTITTHNIMIKKYNKLIRDKILEIIRAAGERPYWRILDGKEYLREIKKKILEEAKELIEAKDKKGIVDEIVDIQELTDVLISETGLTKSEIKKQQKIKNKKRGGFKKKLFLIKTEK